MKIALRRYIKGDWVDFGINAMSGFGGFCHAELVFSDGRSFSSTSRYDANCVDAHGRPKKDGTRWADIDYAKHPERWELVDLCVWPDEEGRVRAFCNSELDARYDFAGCARFALPFWKEHPTEWFCSEIVVAALKQIGFFSGLTPHKTSPNTLAEIYGLKG